MSAAPISAADREKVQRTLAMGVLIHKEAIWALPAYEARVVELEAANEKLRFDLRLIREQQKDDFARAAALQPIIEKMPDWFWALNHPDEHPVFMSVTYGDFRAARAVINRQTEGE